MSTMTRAFRFLATAALVVVVPVYIVGALIGLPFFTVTLVKNPDLLFVAMLMLLIGGGLGLVGLARCSSHASHASIAAIEWTRLLLVFGIVAATCTALVAAAAMLGAPSFKDAMFALAFALPLVIVSIDAMGRIGRLSRLLCDKTGVHHDALPLVFLGIALGLLAAVIAAWTFR